MKKIRKDGVKSQPHSWWARLLRLVSCLLLLPTLITLLWFVYFPGRQRRIALSLATGYEFKSLQGRIDSLERAGIQGLHFNEMDRRFLEDFYICLAKGARLTVVLRNSADLMDHYLDGSGEPFEIDQEIFTDSRKVQQQMKKLKRRIRRTHEAGRKLRDRYTSGRFYMPDKGSWDSWFGLYHGTLEARPVVEEGDLLAIRFRAQVPWEWPSYRELKRKHGNPHAESFPLPILLGPLFNNPSVLYVDNGLGEQLVHLGLAAEFVAYSEWEELQPGG